MHEASTPSVATRVNPRSRAPQGIPTGPSYDASGGHAARLATAPAPSLHSGVRRWHPSVLARSARCAPPTSPSVLSERARPSGCARMGEVVIGRCTAEWAQLASARTHACFRVRALRCPSVRARLLRRHRAELRGRAQARGAVAWAVYRWLSRIPARSAARHAIAQRSRRPGARRALGCSAVRSGSHRPRGGGMIAAIDLDDELDAQRAEVSDETSSNGHLSAKAEAKLDSDAQPVACLNKN